MANTRHLEEGPSGKSQTDRNVTVRSATRSAIKGALDALKSQDRRRLTKPPFATRLSRQQGAMPRPRGSQSQPLDCISEEVASDDSQIGQSLQHPACPRIVSGVTPFEWTISSPNFLFSRFRHPWLARVGILSIQMG